VSLLGAKREVEGRARAGGGHQQEQDHRADVRIALVRLGCGGDEQARTQPEHQRLHPGRSVSEVRRQQ
jgi:hypothetical protein